MILNAQAVITAIDRFSGPVGRMAGSLHALTGAAAATTGTMGARLSAVATSAQRLGRALSGPMALGLGATIYATQEFERRLLGIQMAAMAAKDATGKLGQVNDIGKLQRDAEALKTTVMQLSERLGFSPTGLIQAAEFAAKLGVSLKQSESITKNAAIWNMAEQNFEPAAAAEFLGKLGAMFGAPDDPTGYDKWITAAADKIATVAAASPTDLSSFAEGLRQFAGAFSIAGGTIDQAAAILATATKAGQADIETGTAVKMGLVRLISPTLPHASALSNAGIDRSKYLDITAADPRRAVNQLVQLFPGYINKELKRSLYEQLTEAYKQGRGADPGFIGDIAGRINKATGNKESIDDTAMKVMNAIVTSGGRVDYYAYLRDIAELTKEGKFLDAAFIESFTKFHYSRMKALLGHPDWMDEYYGLSGSATGQGQDTRAQLYRESSAGTWGATVASIERMLNRLRESEGIQNFIFGLERLTNAVASLPPAALEGIGYFVAALSTLAVAGLALGGVAAGLTALASAITWIGGALAAISLPGVLAAGAAGYLGYEAYQNWDKIKGTLGSAYDAVMGNSSAPAAVDRMNFGQSALVRDMVPTAGPAAIDVTGKVQADVQGTVAGRMQLDVDVKVEGPGIVVDKRTSGGDLTGTLNKGKSMPDTTGP